MECRAIAPSMGVAIWIACGRSIGLAGRRGAEAVGQAQKSKPRR